MSLPVVETRAFVALGSNLGDRRASLERAVLELAITRGVRVVASSSWIETEPVGGPGGQGRYLNGVVELATTLTARELFGRLQAIEAFGGRDRAREQHHGPRTLDLDLLTFGDQRIDDPDLTVPHPRMEERLFVLEPLAQIAASLLLPRAGVTVGERVASLSSRRGS